ncbi:exodeoxyribonuclease V subunit gamma [Candidatus Curculioniphilus buchneri]|uniref:exodeoxyribonuclease V subunit gamma n=1 Tax=Candidatus Curculioniphilus buchneri TaxID=690594 RepID=UPI00376F4385
MFIVYHSNQLDILNTLTAELIKRKLIQNPFQPEIILIKNHNIAQWIQISLASQFGIAANIKYFLPADFIWEKLTRILPNVPNEDVFSKTAITWQLMTLLPRLYEEPDFSVIKAYLNNGTDSRKCFQFASQIADLFNKYLVFRPDWLESWSNGKYVSGLGREQRWQATLWRALMEKTKKNDRFFQHTTDIYQHIIRILTECQTRPIELPDRIFICGISILPPIYLQILQALSRHIDIHFLCFNPSRHYWENIPIQSILKMNRAFYDQPNLLDACLKLSHPLLISWGKQGYDNLDLLSQMNDVQNIDAFVEPTKNFLLGQIQHDILELEDHTIINLKQKTLEDNSYKQLLRPDDVSISIHVCHSPQREVEVLHDNLLAMIVQDPTLCPKDIIVIISDIDLYIPAIQAVFNNGTEQLSLPFMISDKKARDIHPILTTFLNLLDLPCSRFTAEQVLGFLEVPQIAARFSINEQELQLLYRWIVNSGIRWGLDDDSLHELMLPTTGQHTWKFGLERMLLGYAMDSNCGTWRGILPYDETNGLLANLVGLLAEFIAQLQHWRNILTQHHPLDKWLICLRKMINDFFILDTTAQTALSILETHWEHVLQSGLEIGYNQPIPIILLRDELDVWLNQERINQSFSGDSISFCTFMPMSFIPFRVICLLGMNDGMYPRAFSSTGFDLMIKHPRQGDLNQNDEDRYLFLEALLSAQQRLYISFIGCSIRNNTLRYPSVLVSDLCDYIEQNFYCPNDEHVDSIVNSDHVQKYLWHRHTRMPFAPGNFFPGRKFQSFANEWLPATNHKQISYSNFSSNPLTKISYKIISFDDLYFFYSHPIRAWFQKRLEISFSETTPELISDEPFIINKITRYQLNNQLLNALVEGKNTDLLFHQAKTAGLLPFGVFGELYWIKQCQQMTRLAKQIRIHYQPLHQDMNIYLTLNNVTLFGRLFRVQENGLLRWSPRHLSLKDGLLLWLEHLIYCAMGGKGESRFFGSIGEWHYPHFSSEKAQIFLASLISVYHQGMMSPLLLFNPGCEIWLNHCFNQKTKCIDWRDIRQQQARDKIFQTWRQNNFAFRENNDPYVNRIIRNLDDQHINEMIETAKNVLLPLFCSNMATKGFKI